MEAVKPVLEYEGVPDVPTCVPLRNILYPVTPTLSVEADHERLIWLAEAPDADKFVGTLGAMMSGTGGGPVLEQVKPSTSGRVV